MTTSYKLCSLSGVLKNRSFTVEVKYSDHKLLWLNDTIENGQGWLSSLHDIPQQENLLTFWVMAASFYSW